MGLFLSPMGQISVGPKAQCKIGPSTLSYPNVIGYADTVNITQEGGPMIQSMADSCFSHSYLQAQQLPRVAAQSLYTRARARGRRAQFWSMLVGRSRGLFDVATVEADCRVTASCDAGYQMVSIDRIRGSEGRVHDFDCDFYPLKDHNRERWLGIAQARHRGRALPPVALIQVGDLYFVRDGHHRISVARALGQLDIEATVIVWQVEGPLPWEVPALAPNHRPVGRQIDIGRVFEGLRREGARVQERVLLSVRNLLGAVSTALRNPAVP
jgi:hypothetical protein